MTTRNDADGYDHLRTAFREAAKVTDTVRIQILGIDGGTWDVDPQTREADDGLDICGGRRVSADSVIYGTFGGLLLWRGGHGMHDGSRTERFNHDGVAMTLTWVPDGRPSLATPAVSS